MNASKIHTLLHDIMLYNVKAQHSVETRDSIYQNIVSMQGTYVFDDDYHTVAKYVNEIVLYCTDNKLFDGKPDVVSSARLRRFKVLAYYAGKTVFIINFIFYKKRTFNQQLNIF